MKGRKVKILGRRYDTESLLTAMILVAPVVLGIGIFYFIPMFQNIFYSFTNWNQFGGYKFEGISNYLKLFKDPEVALSLKNTLTYTLIMVPISIFLAIVIATLLNNKIKGVSFYRLIYFLPAVTMTSAIGMVWRWMFNPNYGIINQILAYFNIQGPNWLTSPDWVMFSLITVGVWSSLGTSVVLYLAGLQGIPRTYYEAAEIDGAGTFRKFFSITLPLLTPTIFFNLITSLISALQVYDLIFMMFSSGNPALRNVQSLSYLFYREAFVFNNKGYAAAISVILLAITLIFTVIQFALQKKWVNY